MHGVVPGAGIGSARLLQHPRRHWRSRRPSAAFEVQEYRRPEFEVIVTPANRFVVQGGEAVATVQARYYFGQPVANARVRYVVNQQAVLLAAALDRRRRRRRGRAQYWYGDDQTFEGELRLDAQGRGEIRVPLAVDDDGRDYSARIEAQVTDASSREVSGNTVVHATVRTVPAVARRSAAMCSGRRSRSSVSAARHRLHRQSAARRAGHARARAIDVSRRAYYSDPERAEVAGQRRRPRPPMVRQPRHPALAADRAPTASARSADVGRSRASIRVSWLWVPGRTGARRRRGRSLSRADRRQARYAPETRRAWSFAAKPSPGPMLVTKEGQHVIWHRVVAAGRRRRDRGARSRPATSATSTSTSRSCATGGCIAPNVACRCPRPNGRCTITLTADRADGQTAGAGRVHASA